MRYGVPKFLPTTLRPTYLGSFLDNLLDLELVCHFFLCGAFDMIDMVETGD